MTATILGIPLSTLIMLMTSAATLMGLAAFFMPALQSWGRASRLKKVRARRSQLRAEQKEKLKAQTLRERFKKKPLSTRILESLKIGHLMRLGGLKTRLSQAGYRDKSAPAVFIILTFLLPVVFAGFAAIIAFKSQKWEFSPPERFGMVAGSILVGMFLPWLMVKNKIIKRHETLTEQFADALDLLLICVQAGLSLEAAFLRVSEEMGDKAGEVCEEMALTAAELAFLGDRRQAFENLATRTGLPAFKSLATSLIQSERYGTPVGVSLKILSEESRTQRVLAVEKKAGALPAKLTVPMIVFFLPVLLMVIIGPAIIQLSK